MGKYFSKPLLRRSVISSRPHASRSFNDVNFEDSPRHVRLKEQLAKRHNALNNCQNKKTRFTSSKVNASSSDYSLDVRRAEQQLNQSLKPISLHSDSVTAITVLTHYVCVTGSADCNVCVQDLNSQECIHKWEPHTKDVIKVCGKLNLIASASRDRTIGLFEIGKSAPVGKLVDHKLAVTSINFDEFGRKLCSGSRDNTVKIWDVETQQIISAKEVSRNLVTDMKWRNGYIAQTSEDKMLKLWDPRTLDVVQTFPIQSQIHTCCDLSEYQCVTGCNGFVGNGCELQLWDIRKPHLVDEYRGHTESVAGVAFLPNSSNTMISCSRDGSVRIWKTKYLKCVCKEEIGDVMTGIAAFDSETVMCSGFRTGLHVVHVNANGQIYGVTHQ